MRTRAYRRHQRARIRARHLRAWRNLVLSPEVAPPARAADHHPLDCGNARCLLCHFSKFHDARRAREERLWRRELE